MIRPTDPFVERYHYQRAATRDDLLPALGIAVGVGALAFYLARIVLRKTPLEREEPARLGEPAHFAEPRPAIRSAIGTALRRDSGA